jgi:hypothetical protein
MSNAPLVGVKACVFDAYGMLFDFAAQFAHLVDETAAFVSTEVSGWTF